MLEATQALTVLAEIDPDRRPELEQRLATIAGSLDHNTVFRPRDLPDTHFTRFVIIDDAAGELPALLAWESNHDGLAPDYLARVARTTPTIDRVLECCRDYPAAGTADVDAWLGWVAARSHRAAAFYTAYRGVPRTRLRADRDVHDALRAIVDRDRVELSALPPTEAQRRLVRRLAAEAPALDTRPDDDGELRWAIGKVLAIVGALLLAPLAVVIVGPWYWELRRRERMDRAPRYDRPVHDHGGLAADEDHGTQNQLTHLVDIKPGWFRLFTLWAVLSVIDVIARVYSVRGDLGGITSIHFARWVIVRDRRKVPARARRHRLLFFSNYDGSWESYLGEFIDRAASGLTAVWSNTVAFPASRSLLYAGARDEEAFKQWTRDHQVRTQVWWSGVPGQTVQNVRDDIWIRRQLHQVLAEDEAHTWLRKI